LNKNDRFIEPLKEAILRREELAVVVRSEASSRND
jgi:hypothetical protein